MDMSQERISPPGRAAVAQALESELVEAVRQYAAALDCAYLFGSRGRGDAGPLSDVDVGLVFSDAISRERRRETQLELIGRLQRVDGPHIDAVILNDAAPLLKHRVVRDGRVLFCADDRRRVAFEAGAIREYLDFDPFLEVHRRNLSVRLREGRFGR